MPVLTVESRENLRAVETGALEVDEPEVTAAELIRLRALDATAHLAYEERKAAVSAALRAFGRGSFLLVVDDRRITVLEEKMKVTEETRVRFWRLVPLVGG